MHNPISFHRQLWVIASLLFVLLLGSCGRNRQEPASEPTSTQNNSSQEPSESQSDAQSNNDTEDEENQSGLAPLSSPESIVDTNFLAVSDFHQACDHAASATISCSSDGNFAKIDVSTNASDFARWRLSWAPPTDRLLNGSETLHVRLRGQGDLRPNIYLNDQTEKRIATPLKLSKSEGEWQDVHIPLAEIQDDENNSLDYENVTEIELVFEWADMAGEIEIEAVQFKSLWTESVILSDESKAVAESLRLPDGFEAVAIADAFSALTQIQYLDANQALVSQQGGRVWRLQDTNNDHIWDERTLYFSGLAEIVGLLHDPTDDSVWVGGRGQLYRVIDSDGNGVADQAELRVDGLPWGRHQNNGLTWNPDPDPFTGEVGGAWIYFGLGSTEDLEIGGDLNATVLRFPKDGEGQGDLEVVSFGNRNAYDVVWGQVAADDDNWHLFASENGPDFNDAPDEVNHIRWKHHYGFPDRFGVNFDEPASEIENLPYTGSLYDVTPHASASGLAFVTNPEWPEEYQGLYVSLFGQVFDEAIVGHTVEHITLSPEETQAGLTFRGEPETFIEGLDRPLPMTTDPDGNLVVGDYATGIIYRVVYTP